jgi:uncharacterized protein (UPF0333 family)
MFKRKGQSTLEYALIVAVVIAGLLVMQYYVKRGFSGRMKQASDDMGEQYDPTAYTGGFAVHQESGTRQTVQARESKTEHVKDQVNLRTGQDNVAAWGAGDDLYKK